MRLSFIIFSVLTLLYFSFLLRNTINADRVIGKDEIAAVSAETKNLAGWLPKFFYIIWPKEVIGKSYWSGNVIVRRGECFDVCPQEAWLSLFYEDVHSEEDCKKIGGKVLQSKMWEKYLGCEVGGTN